MMIILQVYSTPNDIAWLDSSPLYDKNNKINKLI